MERKQGGISAKRCLWLSRGWSDFEFKRRFLRYPSLYGGSTLGQPTIADYPSLFLPSVAIAINELTMAGLIPFSEPYNRMLAPIYLPACVLGYEPARICDR